MSPDFSQVIAGFPIRILVTGASGLIGAPLVRNLCEQGFDVFGFARRAAPPYMDTAHWHRGDMLLPGTVAALVRDVKPTHLVHLAWVTAPGEHAHALSNLDWAAATLELVRRAHEAGVKYALCAGTAAEYDWSHPDFVEGHTPLRPATIYGEVKHHVHQLLSAYAGQTDLSLCWSRVFYPYGCGEHPRRLIPRAIAALARREAFPCSTMANKRDLLYADDMAAAFAALLTAGATGPYNIASGSTVPLRHVLETIAGLLGGAELLRYGEMKDPPGEPEEMRPDISRLRAATGWRPLVTLEEGIKRTIALQLANPLQQT